MTAKLIGSVACEAAVVVSQSDGITAADARECQRQLRSLPPMRPIWLTYDQGERCMGIETLMMIAGSKDSAEYRRLDPLGAGSGSGSDAKHDERAKAFVRLVADTNVDWTELLRRHNKWQDGLVDAYRCPSRKALALLESLEAEAKKTANETAALVMATEPEVVNGWEPKLKAQRLAESVAYSFHAFVPAAMVRIDLRRQAEENLTLLAVALAGYRADHEKKYPATLAELAPAYIDAIPKDPFTDGDLQYRPDGEGYLLYSVGPNGKDEGGLGPESFTQVPSGEHDDISIRMPLKKAESMQ
jgi:hypothetical protein